LSRPAAAADYKVFLLGGQSNIAGRAEAGGLPPELRAVQNDVLLYEGGVLAALDPKADGTFGPEITFGRTIADSLPDENFALIKYGVGGTNLYNDWDPATGGTYAAFRTQVANGLAAIGSGGNTTEIVGMLWTQGERDAKANRTTAQYQADLVEFIADVRTRYGAGLPFYLSRLSSLQTNIAPGQLAEIRPAQASVAAADTNTYMIDTDTFGVKNDNLHFNASGQQDLGAAFAAAYLGEDPGGNPDPDPDPDPVSASVIAHWSFDTDFTDSSVSGNDLSISAGAPSITTTPGEWRFGGGAVDFTSTTSNAEHLALETAINLAAGDAWSVSFWARRRPGTDKTSGMVLGDLTRNGFIWTPDVGGAVSGGGLRFRNSSGASSDFKNIDDDHEYHHWVVIADGNGAITVYRDNVLLGSQSASTTFDITNVGHAYSATKQSYNGQIDELYVFDGAVGADVVNSLYTTNQVPEPTTFMLLTLSLTSQLARRRSQ